MQPHIEISLHTEPCRRAVIFIQLLKETKQQFKQLHTHIIAVINKLTEAPIKKKIVKYLD